MALLRNGSALNQYPLRQLGGGVAADISMANRLIAATFIVASPTTSQAYPTATARHLHGCFRSNRAVCRLSTTRSLRYLPLLPERWAHRYRLLALLSFLADATGGLITSGEGVATLSLLLANALLTASAIG